jgi:hypothetical protein
MLTVLSWSKVYEHSTPKKVRYNFSDVAAHDSYARPAPNYYAVIILISHQAHGPGLSIFGVSFPALRFSSEWPPVTRPTRREQKR